MSPLRSHLLLLPVYVGAWGALGLLARDAHRRGMERVRRSVGPRP